MADSDKGEAPDTPLGRATEPGGFPKWGMEGSPVRIAWYVVGAPRPPPPLAPV
jgi:hypothetical protein